MTSPFPAVLIGGPPHYVARIAHYLKRRHLPLLVDVGGRPTETQQALFGLCTHAILLVAANDRVAYAREMTTWQQMMVHQGVISGRWT